MSGLTILLLVIGLIAGVMSGMFGIGGGIIIVPTLILFTGFSLTLATGTSLVALLLPVGILAVIAYYRNRLIDLRAAALIALGLTPATLLGANIALGVDQTTLRLLYALFLLYASWRYIEPVKWWHERQAKTAKPAKRDDVPPTPPATRWYFLLILGFLAGVVSGMFGVGGGIVIVPVLVSFMNYDQKLAIGTSLAVLLLPVGLPAVLRYAQANQLDWGAAVPVAIGLVLGAVVGAQISIGLPSTTVKRLYGLFLLGVAIYFIGQAVIR